MSQDGLGIEGRGDEVDQSLGEYFCNDQYWQREESSMIGVSNLRNTRHDQERKTAL